jgi:hypothetical protein
MTTFEPTAFGFCAVGRQLFTGPALDIFINIPSGFTTSSGTTIPSGIYQAWYNEEMGWDYVYGAPQTPPTANMGAIGTVNMLPLHAPDAAQPFMYLPSAVSWDQAARLDLFAVDMAGDLWHWWTENVIQPQSDWGSESLGHPEHAGPLVSSPTAVAQGVDKITVFARCGSDGGLHECLWDPANGARWTWHSTEARGWTPEPKPYTLSPAACSSDPTRLDLFAIAGNWDSISGGTVEHTWQTDAPGTASPNFWDTPANSGATSSPVSVSWLDRAGARRITVLYCGPSEGGASVVEFQWFGDHWVTNPLYQQYSGDNPAGVDLGAAGPPALASWGPGRLDAFWWSSDYTLLHYWNPTGEPKDWQAPDNFTLQFPEGSVFP